MTPSWNIEQLREFIRTKREANQHLLDLVHSVDNSINLFRYHLFTARDSLKDFFAPDEDAKPEHLDLIMGGTGRATEFEWAKLANEANTIAAIYTVRSLYDLFAQLVRGLILEKTLSVEECNIHRV